MAVLPLIMTSQGLQPQAPADLRAQLVASVAAINPDYTSNLPGGLIEDIASTDVAACLQSDSFLVDLVNSITPKGANAFILAQFGSLYGLTPQAPSNTSVYVVFFGTPGYVITRGFMVSDGTYQYNIEDGGIIGTDGSSDPLYAVSPLPGTWPVPAGTVTQIVTSVPVGFNLLCANPEDGLPAIAAETISQFRERCQTAGLASSTGMARYLKTLLANVPGVQERLVSVVQNAVTDVSLGSWTVICGGGDPYQVAHTIYRAVPYIPGLAGSIIRVIGVTNTNPLRVTTDNNHNLLDGETYTVQGVIGMNVINNNPQTVTVTGANTFTMPLDGTISGAYRGGGIVTPNPINQTVSIVDYPDTYTIPFVVPPQETVNMVVTWGTNSPNFVSPAAMAQTVGPALLDYINNIPAGPHPINLNEATSVFLEAASGIVPADSIIRLNFDVSVDGIGVIPDPGTEAIHGDKFSYFYADISGIVVVLG